MTSHTDTEMPEVSPAQVAEALANGNVFVLDVREDDEWEAGHIDGATHMALGSLDTSALPSDVPIVAVCRSGGRSGKATEAIAVAGLDVANMTGGMKAWSAAGLPFVDSHGNPGEVV